MEYLTIEQQIETIVDLARQIAALNQLGRHESEIAACRDAIEQLKEQLHTPAHA